MVPQAVTLRPAVSTFDLGYHLESAQEAASVAGGEQLSRSPTLASPDLHLLGNPQIEIEEAAARW